VQHHARVNHSNSGGPLLLANRVAAGINTLVVIGEGDVQGFFYSLALPQLKGEIEQHVPGVVWK
jgi:hypothetical protein